VSWAAAGFFGFFTLAGLALLAWGIRIYVKDSDTPALLFFGGFGLLVTLFCGALTINAIGEGNELAADKVDRDRAENCTVEILDLDNTGSSESRRDVYRFQVRVSSPGKSPYRAESVSPTSNYDVARIAAGRDGYACLVDRDDPERVEILWDRPID